MHIPKSKEWATLGHMAIACVCLTVTACASKTPTFDLAIVGGRVIDPESGLDAIRNVGVSDGVILSVTDRPITGTRVIDAEDLVVAPGFIDLHAHDHNDVTYRLHAQDGVTTALELELGVFPAEKWLARRRGNSAINFGASASHGIIRAVAFDAATPDALTGEAHLDQARVVGRTGWMVENATPDQLRRMDELMRGQWHAGAIGVGYHLAVTPGADHSEMMHFYALSAVENVPNFIHIRSIGQVSPTEAALEVVDGAETTGAAIHAVHINSSGLWETRDLLQILEKAQDAGLDITTEVYPYTGASSALNDPRATPKGLAAFRIDYSDLELVATGERLTEESFAYHRQHDPSGELIVHLMDQADIDRAVEHPMVMIASDGGAFLNGKGHPRGAGTFARIFRRYVRERQTLSLMDAINKVSTMPAGLLEDYAPAMKKRGRVQEGMIADLTLFDAQRIADQATYAEGGRPSVGIAYVLVNGQAVVDNYRFVEGVKPGRPILGLKAQR